MYTSCPQCGTVFSITTADLRLAGGFVECGTCATTFNAVLTLTDDLPAGETAASEAGEAASADGIGPAAEGPAVADSERSLEFSIPESAWSGFFDSGADTDTDNAEPLGADLRTKSDDTPPADVEVAAAVSPATGEADDDEPVYVIADEDASGDGADGTVATADAAPGIDDDTETTFWLDPSPDLPADDQAAALAGGEQAPAGVVPGSGADIDDAEWDDRFVTGERRIFPTVGTDAWPGDEPVSAAMGDRVAGERWQAAADPAPAQPWPPQAVESTAPRARFYALGSVALLLLLAGQVLHNQRDALAASPAWGHSLQRAYGFFGMPLYPTWNTRAFEVRGSEAVAGRTTPGVLEVLARITIIGNEPVGMPMVRVTLRDRFANVIGTRLFGPDEYTPAGTPPARLLFPGSTIPVRIALKDPGSDAYGYEVDVCQLTRQGPRCQQAASDTNR
jgi:predicted Zn finger-like uncharacterized protein